MKSFLQKVASWITTPVFLFVFAMTLLSFHPLFWIAHRVSRARYQQLIELMCFLVILELRIFCGAKLSLSGLEQIEKLAIHKPVPVVSNHQSMFDIALLIYYLRKITPKFISKIELGKGIPSVSYLLRTMGSLLIDRGDRASSIRQISSYALEMRAKKFTVCLFPEGTRARDGVMKPFKIGGFASIVEQNPNLQILPVAIQGSWEFLRYKYLPIPFGVTLSLDIHAPRIVPSEIEQDTVSAILSSIEEEIRSAITRRATL